MSDIKAIREIINISQQAMADELEVPKSRLAKWEERGTIPKRSDYVKLLALLKKYVVNHPQLNDYIERYYIGDYPMQDEEIGMVGEPLAKYESKAGKEFTELSDGRYLMNTPLVTQRSYNGYLTGWGDPEFVEELPMHPVIVDKPHKGTYRSFESKGDSMNDGTSRSIEDKDILTGRRIERSLWKNKLHLTKYKEFVIVTYKKGIVTKNISAHDTENHTITCHSYNPDKEQYPDFVLNLDDVMEIYNIVQITKKR